jgi:DNA topoisomerase-1
VLAYRALRDLEPADGPRAAKRNVIEAVRISAGGLGNTAAVARRSYIHPAVLDGYLAGELDDSRIVHLLEQTIAADARRVTIS